MGEEHPNAQPFMTIKNRNQFYFEGEIPQLPGLARFILGLPGEVKLEEGEEMRSYLKEQIGRGVFFNCSLTKRNDQFSRMGIGSLKIDHG